MVVLAEKFSSKLKDKQVSITDDEVGAFLFLSNLFLYSRVMKLKEKILTDAA